MVLLVGLTRRCIGIVPALAFSGFLTPATAQTLLDDAGANLDLPPRVDAALVVGDSVCPLSHSPTGHATRFHSASISKLLTATVVAQLIEEDRLQLDDRIAQYVPEFADSPITVGELLTHTSGLRDRQRANGRDSEQDVNSYVERLARQNARNRGEWRYADANFNVLGRAIEAIEDKPYAEVLDARIISPLGMTASTFLLAEVPETDRVRAFDDRRRPEDHPWDLAFLPSAGLQSVATDLALFARAILRTSKDADGGLTSSATLSEFTTTRTSTDWGIGQAYGWQIGETPLGPQWRHAGGEAGFESLLAIYPEAGIAVVVLGNQEDWPRFELERILREHAAGLTACPTDH